MKQNNILTDCNNKILCFVCGKQILDNSSKEHIIPKCFFEYHHIDCQESDCEWNLSFSHEECNFYRSSSFICSDIYKNITIEAFKIFLTLVIQKNHNIKQQKIIPYNVIQEAKIRKNIQYYTEPKNTLQEIETKTINKNTELAKIKNEIKILKKEIIKDILEGIANEIIIEKQKKMNKLKKQLDDIKFCLHELKKEKFYHDNKKIIIEIQKNLSNNNETE